MNTAKQLLLEKRSFWSGLEGVVLMTAWPTSSTARPRQGFIVKTVAKDSPGDQIGLRGSTMIASIAGQEVPLGRGL